jgi:uncharacterized small protein (DUF1192 family)
MSEIKRLQAELDRALESRREWMEKVTVDRQEIARLKALLTRAAAALDNGDLAILEEMREAAK